MALQFNGSFWKLPCCPVFIPHITGGPIPDPLETWNRSVLHWPTSEFAVPALLA